MLSFSTMIRTVVVTSVVIVSLLTASDAQCGTALIEVRESLNDLNRSINTGAIGQMWKEVLRIESLEAMSANSRNANATAVTNMLRHYQSRDPNVNRPEIVRVRRALEAWLAELPPRYTDKEHLAEVYMAKGDVGKEAVKKDVAKEAAKKDVAKEAAKKDAGKEAVKKDVAKEAAKKDAGKEAVKVYTDELANTARLAKDAFIPRAEINLLETKSELVKTAHKLDVRLKPTDPQSERWRAYLKWSHLVKQLGQAEGPDLKVLDTIHAKYAAGHKGLELACFANVRLALHQYLAAARTSDAKLKSQHQQLLDALPEYLEDYSKKPSTEGATTISSAARWLEEAGQAPWLVADIRRQYTRTNFFVRINANMIDAGISQPMSEIAPVHDWILGTRITGTGHTAGQTSVELIPSSYQVALRVLFQGTTTSDTVGVNGPARIYSHGTTHLRTWKSIFLDANHFSTTPASSQATTSTSQRVSTPGRGRIVQNAARKRAYAQKSQAEQISARHAEARANQRFDQQVTEMLGNAQRMFDTKVRGPLTQQGMYPRQLNLSTTSHAVWVNGLQADPHQLGAPNNPPPVDSNLNLVVQMHESTINNVIERLYGDKTFTEQQFQENLADLLGEMSKQFQPKTPLEPEDQREPWAITFPREHPVMVSFADNQIRLTIRGKRYTSGDRSYPGMNVTAVYKLVQDGLLFKAVRQDTLEIFPPGFTPGSGRRLSVRQQTTRQMLERRFDGIFKKEFFTEPLRLPSPLDDAGICDLKAWETADGWMTVAWNFLPYIK